MANINTRLDPVARAVQIRAHLPNVDDLLKPGMFLTVDLQRDRGDVLAVPASAARRIPSGVAACATTGLPLLPVISTMSSNSLCVIVGAAVRSGPHR